MPKSDKIATSRIETNDAISILYRRLCIARCRLGTFKDRAARRCLAACKSAFAVRAATGVESRTKESEPRVAARLGGEPSQRLRSSAVNRFGSL